MAQYKSERFDDLPELVADMKLSLQEMEPYRRRMLQSIKQSAGKNYGNNGGVLTPINLLALYERIVMAHLVGGDPRMMVGTFDNHLRPMCSQLETDCNRDLRRMNYRATLERTVRSGLHGFGIQRVAITAPAEARFGGYEKIVGEPMISHIDVEDFVCDMRGKLFGECGYQGHLYTAPYDYVKESKLFNAQARKAVTPSDDKLVNEATGDTRLMTLGRGHMDPYSYQKFVLLWEIYLPRQGLVVTFDAQGDFEIPLLVQKWFGPPCGPYHFLGFDTVVGNLLPKSPIMDLQPQAEAANVIWQKLNHQAMLQKSVVAYLKAEDAEKVDQQKDGGFIQSDNPDWVQEKMVHSGPNVNNANWLNISMNTYSEFGGNLRAMGGLASQADTATQEKLIHSSASTLVQSQGQKVFSFVQGVMRSFAEFRWTSPHKSFKSEYSAPGVPDIVLNRELKPIERFGIPFADLDIQVDPYSFSTQTPSSKLALIDSVLKNDIIPVLPLFGQAGVGEMLDKAIRLKAKYANCPELIELLEMLTGIQGPAEGTTPTEPGMPPETTRNYVRTSQPGMTDEGHSQVLQQLMAGGQPADGAQGGGLGQMGAA